MRLAADKTRQPKPGGALEAICAAVERAQLSPMLAPVGGKACGTAKPVSLKRVDPMDLIAREVRLKSMPLVVHQLERLMEKPATSSDDLARVISLDTGMSAQLLRVVNSAMYGFPSKVETISRAVTILGTRRLSMLALGATVVGAYKEGVPGLNMRAFWQHSVGCAVVGRALAVRSGKEPGERAFVAGLLHDVGKLVLMSAVPEYAGAAQYYTGQNGVPVCQWENDELFFDHARLGAILLRKWNFPLPLAKAVLYHHAPGRPRTTWAPAWCTLPTPYAAPRAWPRSRAPAKPR